MHKKEKNESIPGKARPSSQASQMNESLMTAVICKAEEEGPFFVAQKIEKRGWIHS